MTFTDEQRQSRRESSSPDYLTCGQCAREFLLENITLFIAHKACGCGDKGYDDHRSDITDPGEDASSPLTCSVCSRVYMTARGLLQHVQREHNMKICVRKGPLILPEKGFRSPVTHSMSCPPPRNRTPVNPTNKQVYYTAEEGQTNGDLDPSQLEDTYGETQKPVDTMDVTSNQETDYRGADQSPADEPEDLSRRSRSMSRSDRYSRSPSRSYNTDPVKPPEERPPRASSLPKKRRTTSPGLSSVDTNMTFTSRPLNGSEFTHGLDRDGHVDNETGTDPAAVQYRDNEEDSPICLVKTDSSNSNNSSNSNADGNLDKPESEHAKNVKLKELLMRQEYDAGDLDPQDDPEMLSLQAGSVPVVKIEEPSEDMDDGENYARRPSDKQTSSEIYGDRSSDVTNVESFHRRPLEENLHHQPQPRGGALQASAAPPSSIPHMSSGYRRSQQMFGVSTIKQSIDQIIREQVMDETHKSPPSRPASSSSCGYPTTNGPQLLPVTQSPDYQGMPLAMPPLITPSQLNYFPRQGYGQLSPRSPTTGHIRAPGPHAYHLASPGRLNKSRDLSPGSYDGGVFTTAAHEGSGVARLALGYHPKSGYANLGRGGPEYKQPYRPALYGGDIDLQHWAALTGDGYTGAIASRLTSGSPVDMQVTNSELDDSKSSDGRMKKRRYPTSRPFKCAHCDQAFNQRIHLKKHMSKHTGVKPFKCQQCNYSTVERSHLKVHYRIHTGEKPYRCMFCDYATAQNSTLKIHLKRHHEGQQAVQRDNNSTTNNNNNNSNNRGKNSRQAAPTNTDNKPRRDNHESRDLLGAGSRLPVGGDVYSVDSRDVKPDLSEELHAYLARHPDNKGGPQIASPSLRSASDGCGPSARYGGPHDNYPREEVRVASGAPVWPEMLDSRVQTSASASWAGRDPKESVAGALGGPVFPRNMYMERYAHPVVSPSATTEGNTQNTEKEKDLDSQQEKSSFMTSNGSVGQDDKRSAVHLEVISEDDDSDLNYETGLKSVVIPDKAFVRG